MLDRVAVFTASPVATLLTLLLELLLSFGIGESQAKLDTIMIDEVGVILSDDTLSDLTRLKSGTVSWGRRWEGQVLVYLAKPTSLETPDGTSRQILVEMALKGRK